MSERDTAEFRALIEQYVAALDELAVFTIAAEERQRKHQALQEEMQDSHARHAAAHQRVRDLEKAIWKARGIE